MDTSLYTNWLEIDLKTISDNLRAIQVIAGKPVMAVVKANAYGHGLVRIAQTAFQTGISWFGVARMEEAITLRDAGIDGNILVLGYTPPQAIEPALQGKIHLTIYDRNTAVTCSEFAIYRGKKIKVHLKIDSGMGRLGIFPEEGLEFIRWLYTLTGLEVIGVFTHFARGDEPEQPATASQLERFDRLIRSLDAANLRPPFVHASNSGGTLAFPTAKYDLLRPGIIAYGYAPSEYMKLPAEIKPALQWKTRLTSVKMLPPGHGVSYGHRYVTKKLERVGAIAVGYADGYRRVDGNCVLIRGKRTPVIGRVCMDQSMISLDHIPDAQVGDEVVLIGNQDEEQISVEDIATRWGTINYEVIATLAARVSRLYFES